MIQEDKELLLKDLCARLTHGVKVSLQTDGRKLTGVLDAVYPTDDRVIVDNLSQAIAPINVRTGGFLIERDNVKPFLRPMSSMTEEERNEYFNIIKNTIDFYNCPKSEDICFLIIPIDWLNAHHFDYRGLIEKCLALEASKGMYNLEKE